MAPDAYHSYRQLQYSKKNKLVYCPHCHSSTPRSMTLEVYKKNHLPRVHDFNEKVTCPFCLMYRWLPREVSSQAVNVHRMACMRAYFPNLFPSKPIISRNVPGRPPLRLPTGTCTECVSGLQMSRGTPNETWGSFCEDVGTMPPFMKPPFLPTHVSFYEWSGLGDFMCPIVREFEEGDDHMWYHISVRAEVWEEFINKILSIDDIYLLPYWCLCDGGKDASPAHKNHRHMVLVKKKYVPLDQKWKDVMKCGNSAAKFKKPIIKLHHLINTLFYISQPRAQCDGTANFDFEYEGESLSHYYRHVPLYPHAKVPMYMLVEEGLHSYIKLRGEQRDPTDWFYDIEGRGLARNIPIRLLGIDITGCILPLAKNLEFSHATDEAPDDCPYLWMYDKAMVLKTNPALADMSQNEWCEHQRNTGNIFLDAVHEDRYILEWFHRRMVNFGIKLEETYKEKWHKEERDRMNMANEMLERVKSDLEKCQKERDYLKIQLQCNEQTSKAVEDCKRQYEERIQKYEERIQKYEERIQRYEDRIQQYEKKEAERIVQLMAENEMLKREIETLRRANEELSSIP